MYGERGPSDRSASIPSCIRIILQDTRGHKMRSLLLVVLLAVVCHASSQGTTTSAGTRANSQDQPSVVTTEDPSQTDSDTLINASSWPQILQDLSNVLSSPSGSLSECSRARLPAGSMEWNDGIGESSLTVEWGYGNVSQLLYILGFYGLFRCQFRLIGHLYLFLFFIMLSLAPPPHETVALSYR